MALDGGRFNSGFRGGLPTGAPAFDSYAHKLADCRDGGRPKTRVNCIAVSNLGNPIGPLLVESDRQGGGLGGGISNDPVLRVFGDGVEAGAVGVGVVEGNLLCGDFDGI